MDSAFILLFCTIPAIIFFFLIKYLTKSRRGRGKSGELVTRHFLESLNKGERATETELFPLDVEKYKIINNLTIKHRDFYTQIDHIVLSRYGVFVIETKVRHGSIYGNTKSKVWMQYAGKSSYEMQNPIHQNYRHVRTVKEMFLKLYQMEPVSIIAFSGDTELHVSGQFNNCHIVRISEVTSTIKRYKVPVLSSNQVDEMYHILLEYKKISKSIEAEHLEYLKKKHHLR